MANNTNQHDLRNGKPQVAPTVEAQTPGKVDVIMPMPNSGQHAVNPGVGSKAGVAEGQVTKSN